MPTPNIQLRRLAAEMMRLRLAAGLTQEQVTEATHISRAALSRAENAVGRPHLKSLVTLLDLYDVQGPKREELIELHRAVASRAQSGWLARYDEALPGEYPAYIQFEAEATRISAWHGFVVPGLLQIPGYARAVVEAGGPDLPARAVSNRVEARLARQAVLHRTDHPLELHAIIDEAALRRPIGGSAVLAAQLRHLLEAMEWPNVVLQVIPESIGGHAGLSGPFSLLSFENAPSVVYLENVSGDVFLEDKSAVDRFRTVFDYLRGSALDADRTRHFVEQILKDG